MGGGVGSTSAAESRDVNILVRGATGSGKGVNGSFGG